MSVFCQQLNLKGKREKGNKKMNYTKKVLLSEVEVLKKENEILRNKNQELENELSTTKKQNFKLSFKFKSLFNTLINLFNKISSIFKIFPISRKTNLVFKVV